MSTIPNTLEQDVKNYLQKQDIRFTLDTTSFKSDTYKILSISYNNDRQKLKRIRTELINKPEVLPNVAVKTSNLQKSDEHKYDYLLDLHYTSPERNGSTIITLLFNGLNDEPLYHKDLFNPDIINWP